MTESGSPRYPTCYRYWVEAMLSPGTWDSDLDGIRAGCSSLAEAVEQARESIRRGGRWFVPHRIVTPFGEVVAVGRPEDA